MNKVYCFALGFILAAWLFSCDSCRGDQAPAYLPPQSASTVAPPAVEVVQGQQIPTPQNFRDIIRFKDTGSTRYRDTGSIRYQDTGSIQYVPVPVDTQAILADYRRIRMYDLTYRFSAGRVRIRDTIGANQLLSQGVTLDSVQGPRVAPSRVKGYLVGGVQGMASSPAQSVIGGFMLQLKNDNAIEVDALIPWKYSPFQSGPIYQLTYKHKLSFSNRKN